jgi:hypothetical protein
MARQYSSISQETTLSANLTNSTSATNVVVASATNLLGGVTLSPGDTFTIVIDPDTANEEICYVTNVTGTTLTVERAQDSTSALTHSVGAKVRHMAIGADFTIAEQHRNASAQVHGLTTSSAVVGTLDTQTLTNKTLTSPTITDPVITGTATAGTALHFEGSTSDDNETILTVVDPTQDNTITLPNTSGTVILDSATQTLTNKTLTSPIISGSPVITGLSSAGMSASSATPKDYVDSILGSATAASTSAASAAVSAAAAATSASSASTSANSAAASALAASTSATSASASASAASTSATAAATSASSASASATAASSSETAAATSASSAAASASAASTSASSASVSATAAATSASSAAASVTAAASSASDAATSASSASTSANSASASATAAATSASSASASATAASSSATAAATSASSAAASASAASTSETAAATSASSAAVSASAASTSATSAAASATAASTSANSASASATAAASSETAANSSAIAAAASYDQFDDRYLGDKTADPSVDNDGNPLITGALYFNSVLDAMKVYNGASWDLVAPDTSAFIDKAILTGKGSLISASAGSTPVALTAATTNGYVLTVNSATTSGLEWAAPSAADITEVIAGTGLTGGGTSGVVTLNADIDTSVTSTSTSKVASASAVKEAYDLADAAIPKTDIDTTTTSTSTTKVASASAVKAAYDQAELKVASVTSGDTSRISIGGTSTAPTVDLVTSGVTAATYTNTTLTVDAYGRITSASTGGGGGVSIAQVYFMKG